MTKMRTQPQKKLNIKAKGKMARIDGGRNSILMYNCIYNSKFKKTRILVSSF